MSLPTLSSKVVSKSCCETRQLPHQLIKLTDSVEANWDQFPPKKLESKPVPGRTFDQMVQPRAKDSGRRSPFRAKKVEQPVALKNAQVPCVHTAPWLGVLGC